MPKAKEPKVPVEQASEQVAQTAPVAAAAAPQEPPVTDENFLDHSKTPPAMLHEWARNYASKPKAEREGMSDDLHALLEHKNTPTDALKEIYRVHGPSVDPEENELTFEPEIIDKLLQHPNAPAAEAEHVIQQLSGQIHPRKTWHENTLAIAAKHPGVDRNQIMQNAISAVENPDLNWSRMPTNHLYDLDPIKLLEKLNEKQQWQPEAPGMTDEQKTANNRTRKLYALAMNGLTNTTKHTPENTQAVLNTFLNQDHEAIKNNRLDQFLADYTKSNPHLTSVQLDQLFHGAKSNSAHEWDARDDELKSAVIEHPNVDPAFLSRIVLAPDDEGSIPWKTRYLPAALSSPKLPEATRKKFIDDLSSLRNFHEKARYEPAIHHFADSPFSKPEDLEKLHDSGFTQLYSHSKFPQERLASDWEKTKQNISFDEDTPLSRDTARRYLGAKNLPTSIIKEIVDHKNTAVAAEALNHPNVDEDVVRHALKRRAKAVQEAAARHPKAPPEHVIENLKSGKTSAYKAIFGDQKQTRRRRYRYSNNDQNSPTLEVTPDIAKAVSERYSGMDPKNIQSVEGKDEDSYKRYLKVKHFLAMHEGTPPEIRDKNAKDIVETFKSARLDPAQRDLDSTIHLGQSVKTMASQGERRSQEALLDNLDVARGADFNTTGYSNDYLNRLVDKVINSASPLDDSSILGSISANPNINDEVFEKATLNPFYVARSNNYFTRYRTTKTENKHQTVIDAHMENKPESYVLDYFSKLQQMNSSDANEMISFCSSAPPEFWHRAFKSLGPAEQSDLIRKISPENFLSGPRRERALMGEYSVKGGQYYGYGMHNPSYIFALTALKTLDPKKQDHKELLNKFLDKQASLAEGDSTKISPSEFTENLNPMFYDKNHNVDAYKQMMSTPDDANRAYGLKFLNELYRQATGFGRYTRPLTEIPSYIDKVKALVEHGTEGPSDPVTQKRWLEMLKDESTAFVRDAVANKEKGKLDFLVDLNNPELTEQALLRGVLSSEKAKGLKFLTPGGFKAAMTTAKSSTEKKTILQNAILSNDLHPEVISHIGLTVEPHALIPPRDVTRRSSENRSRLSDEEKEAQFKQAEVLADKLVDHFIKSPSGAEVYISRFVRELVGPNSASPNEGGFYAHERNKLISKIVQKLESLPDKETASRTMYAIYKGIGGDTAKAKLPSSFLKGITKVVIDSDNLGQAIQMVSDGISDSRLPKFITKKIKNPEILTDENLISLQKSFSPANQASRLTDLKTFKAVNNELIKRAAQKPLLKKDLMVGLASSVSGPDLSAAKAQETIERNHYAIDMLASMQEIGSSYPTQSLIQMALNENLGKETCKRAFLAANFAIGVPAEISLSSTRPLDASLANDPEIVENAAGGGKLKWLMASFKNLNPVTMQVITNRVVNSTELTPADKGWFAARAITNERVRPEDAVKLVRSMGPESVIDTVSQSMGLIQSGEAPFSSIHHLFDFAGSSLDAAVSGEIGVPQGGAVFDKEHRKFISKKLGDILNVVSKYPDVPTSDRALKNEKVNSLLDKSLSATEKLLDHLSTIKDSKIEDLQEVHGILKGMYQGFNLSNRDRKDYRIYTDEHAAKSLSLITKWNEMQGAETAEPSNFLDLDPANQKFYRYRLIQQAAQQHAQLLYSWVGFSRPSKEDWPNLFETEPALPFYLASAEVIPLEAAMSMPIDKMVKSSHANTIEDIIQKVDYNSLPQVVPSFLEKMEKAADVDHKVYRGIVSKCLNVYPAALDYKRIKTLQDKDPTFYSIQLSSIIYCGAGGKDLFHDEVKKIASAIASEQPATHYHYIFKSPHVSSENEKILGSILDSIKNDSARQEALQNVADNIISTPRLVSSAIDIASRNDDLNPILQKSLSKHPNAPREWVMQSYEKKRKNYKVDFESRRFDLDEFENPTYGGELFRSLPEATAVPSRLKDYLDANNLIYKTEYSVSRNRLKQILPKIPAEGISWVDFKRANKAMENWPETRKLFETKMSGADKITPEDVASTMQKYPANEFHVSYSIWGGAQRHMDQYSGKSVPNLVMQVNTSSEIEKELAKDPKLFKFFAHVQKWGNYSGHPVNPHCIGWVRIDTTNQKDGWVVEEFQSDFSARLRRDLEEIIKQRPQRLYEELGFYASSNELMQFAAKTEKILQGWYHAAIAGVEELARKQGVKTLYLHGPNIRARMSGLDPDRPYPVKLLEMYDQDPPKFGYEKCDYSEYPSYNQSLIKEVKNRAADPEKQATRCWRKRLA